MKQCNLNGGQKKHNLENDVNKRDGDIVTFIYK
jgi:hypothetical protein